MAGLGDESEGVRAQAEDESREDVEEGGGERDFEDALHGAVVGGDHVHKNSVMQLKGSSRQEKISDLGNLDVTA